MTTLPLGGGAAAVTAAPRKIRKSAGPAGDRGPGPVAVGHDGHAEVVAVAVRSCGDCSGGAGDSGVPAVLDALTAVEGEPDGPVAGVLHGDVEVEPVTVLLTGREYRGAVAAVGRRGSGRVGGAATGALADGDVGAALALV